MSKPINPEDRAPSYSKRIDWDDSRDPRTQLNSKTSSAAASSFPGHHETNHNPLNKRQITDASNKKNISKTYDNTIRRKTPRNKDLPLTNQRFHPPIETNPTAETKSHQPRNKTKKPSATPPSAPQSAFRFTYLFFSGICALIGAFLYGLFRIFRTQTTESPLTIEKEQREPLIPFLSKKEKGLSYLESRNNPDFMRNLNSLKSEHSITGVRPIRGDGNCYYRAVLFGFLEQVIQKEPRERQSRLAHIIGAFQQIEPKARAHQQFIGYLEEAAANSIWNSIEELEATFLDERFNSVMIRSARDLLAHWTKQNTKVAFNELTLEDAITTGYGNIETFISEVIRPERRCAEGPSIDLGGLGAALDFTLTTYLLPSTNRSQISIIRNSSAKTGTEEVNIVLRPGHYDLLYKSSHVKKIRRQEQKKIQAALLQSTSYVFDKNIYGSRPLDSIKYGLMGFENSNEQPLPLSEEVANQIDTLKAPPYNIEKWRPVAGDGDCYYRANMFGLIEQIIKNDKRQRFNDLARVFETITSSLPRAQKSAHERFIVSLRAAALGNEWETLNSFKHAVVDLNTGLDQAMVRAARYLVASKIEERNATTKTEIAQIEGISLEQCCNQIRTMGDYRIDYHINTGILNSLLGFSLTLHTASAQGPYTIEQGNGLETEKVSILLIPESQHYVLVYPKSSRA